MKRIRLRLLSILLTFAMLSGNVQAAGAITSYANVTGADQAVEEVAEGLSGSKEDSAPAGEEEEPVDQEKTDGHTEPSEEEPSDDPADKEESADQEETDGNTEPSEEDPDAVLNEDAGDTGSGSIPEEADDASEIEVSEDKEAAAAEEISAGDSDAKKQADAEPAVSLKITDEEELEEG